MSRRKRSARSIVGNILLNIAAAGGVLCILAVVASFAFDITLIMFKTGSMSPTIPTGSLAVVREIPASEIKVGDVVTVDRAGQPPITHRVTSISPATGDQRTITMRGDANPTDDQAPYTLEHARIVLASFPGLAYVVVALAQPMVLAVTTLGATVLVAWAFWPRSPRRKPANRPAPAVTFGSSLLLAAAIVGLSLNAPSSARAAETETVVTGTYITLTSIGDPDVLEHLAPESPAPWQVGVEASPPEHSTIGIGISAQGTPSEIAAVRLVVSSCSVRWINGVCTGTQNLMLALQNLQTAVVPAEPNGSRMLGLMDSTAQWWLLVQVMMQPGTPPGSTVGLQIHAWGPGDEIAIGADALAATGVSPLPSSLLAVGAILGGLALAAIVGRRRSEEATA